eukprot:jgi/Chlat1/7338/Chrsp59S06955
MQSLQARAAHMSGVAAEDACAIDDVGEGGVSMYDRLGQNVFVKLSQAFYDRVYADDQEWFRSIFANSAKEVAVRNQYEFFIQRMGGPNLYSERKGHPALIGRHGPYAVTEAAAERWLHHMQAALKLVPEIDANSNKIMMDYFRHTAYFLVVGKELVNRQRLVGYGGRHRGGA